MLLGKIVSKIGAKQMYYYEYFRDKEEQEIMCFNKDLTYFSHIHRAVEIIWCENKRIDVTVNNVIYRLNEGDICFIHSEWQHEMKDYSSNTCLLIPPCALGNYYQFMRGREPGGCLIKKERAAPIKDFFDKYVRENIYAKKNPVFQSGMIDLLLGMFIEELTVIKKKTPETGDYGIVSKIVEYISLNFANELSIEKVAEDLNYNKYYISKVFNNIMKISFRDYLNLIRLADFRANFHKDRSIEQQIAECGFTSRQTFYRAFRKQYGTTPNEFFSSAKKDDERFFADVRP